MNHLSPPSMIRQAFRISCCFYVVAHALCSFFPCVGQEQTEPPTNVQYSDEVVAKAESVLAENGLKRVGTQIQVKGQTDLVRLFSDENKLSRELRLARTRWEESSKSLSQVEQQIEAIEIQVGKLNAQYAAVGNPLGRNNELVARINAGNAQQKQAVRLRDKIKEENSVLKIERGKKEEEYAELVLKMRRIVDSLKEAVANCADVKEISIALQVLATRYETPKELDSETLIGSIERRIRKLEESVFSELIPLDSQGGGLTVQAVVGLEPVEMLIDSGAAMVLIPNELAEKLKIEVPPDAKDLNLKTADGRTVPAKQVFLPRVRVGKFEAENVKAAMLDESFPGAKPLLGMSFLERFKFEVDNAQKTLKLLKVETHEK